MLSLLLLVLLENSSRRGEEAAQEKLNVLAEALSDLMASQARKDPELEPAIERLRDAVGLEAAALARRRAALTQILRSRWCWCGSTDEIS